ncbi:MAG: family N-acetyltransferase [Hyphomicrobiales bacterium]|nr:family N-acetyltransferase [Hyphomicrobiales bacterium]
MTPALRPYLPTDAASLAAIFQASIEDLTEEDYTEAQRGAWAAVADDEEAFAARLAVGLTLIATIEGEPVGFVSLRGTEEIDLLYVLPSAARHGVGTLLCDALEKIATARGAKKLTVDASDTAEPFFLQRGYIPQSRNTRVVADEWLGNTTMSKELVAPGKS